MQFVARLEKTGELEPREADLEVKVSESGRCVSNGYARQVVRDDIVVTRDVVGVNASVGEHE
jgi:hypothetical protein